VTQRLPTRLTGPPRFIGVPGRTASRATARPTGRGRSTTPGLTMHPAGYATYWQYTTALAGSVLAATTPVISSADSAIENFILASSILIDYRCYSRQIISRFRISINSFIHLTPDVRSQRGGHSVDVVVLQIFSRAEHFAGVFSCVHAEGWRGPARRQAGSRAAPHAKFLRVTIFMREPLSLAPPQSA
jgi:hypothetical protein